MPDTPLNRFELEAIRRLPATVAENSQKIDALHEDIHEINEALKSNRVEAREDTRSVQRAILSFAVALAVPIILAALKLAFLT